MNIIWNAELDNRYQIYVERVEPYKGELVIKEGDKVLTRMFVAVAYDALFGPDICDVEKWQTMCIDFIDNTLNK